MLGLVALLRQNPIEIQMDYFTRAVETVLTSGLDWDGIGLELGPAHWERAVRESGYVRAGQSGGKPSCRASKRRKMNPRQPINLGQGGFQ